MDESLLFGFGFGNLAMLGWLAAAAAPLLIHLWSRRQFRETPWAAMAFLLAAMRRHSRRIRFQQWLLLAVRTLIIAAVVLAVAQPYSQPLAAGITPGAPAHRVLVIDGSMSMALRPHDGSLWERSKRLAAELVTSSGPGDGFTVVLLSRRPQTVVGPEAVDRAAVAARIEALRPTHGRGDLPAVLDLVDAALQASESGRIDRREVYFFTDLQRTTWQSAIGDSRREVVNHGASERLAKLAERASLTVVDVAPPRAANLAVTQLSAVEPYVIVGQLVTFEAVLHEFGDQPRSECAVELIVDGVVVGEQSVDVPAGGEATARFTHRFLTPGSHTVAVRTVGDQLRVDNSRWLVANARDQVRLLCVAGSHGAARYVADALDPDPADESALRPEVVSDGMLAELELTPFDCVLLCNVGQLSDYEAERLRQYAEQGGGVVFFLGDRVLAEQYNALAEGDQPLLPAQIGELVSGQPPAIDPLGYRHPIVAPFRGRERAGLLSTPIAKYYRLIVLPASAHTEVALATAEGDPLIVAAPVGRGRAVLVATAGSLTSIDTASGQPWTLWPTWPSFLPIVREMVAYASAGERGGQLPAVDDELGQVLPAAATGDVVRITRPDGQADSVGVTPTESGWRWCYDQTELSGIYQAQHVSTDEPQPFAVNVDTAESDLRKVAPQQLPEVLTVRDRWQESVTAADGGIAPRDTWHRDLLWAALVLVLLECWLAWQFGRGIV